MQSHNYNVKDTLESILKFTNANYELLDDNDALKYAKFVMETIVFPFLNDTCIEDANFYCVRRDNANLDILSALNDELLTLNSAFADTNFEKMILPMSSVTAGLNLINGSDVDIGLCIKDLCDGEYVDDQEILETVHDILTTHGYVHERDIGYIAGWPPKNRYKIYTKKINGIDFEVKIRDLENTRPIVNLHKKLDSILTREQKALYTYGKLLLEKSDYKKLFKLFVYMEQFFGIEGAFKMPAV